MAHPLNAEQTNEKTSPNWLTLAGLAVICFVLFYFRLGSYSLFDVDEPRYAEAAREMIERGNWITPYFNYELRFDKPVMHYWLIALSYKAFGVSEFAARLVSALAATLMVLLTFWVGCRMISQRFGLFSALILASSIEIIGLAHMSITDMTLTAFMTGTTLCLFLAAQESRKWWLAAGLFSGLAILTKGPVGIVVPGAILFLYAPLVGQWKQVFLNRWFVFALLIAFGLSLPWYFAAYQQNGQIFLDMLVLHNVVRYTGTVTGHDQPWWFFLLVMFVGFVPWSIFLPTVIRYWVLEARERHAELLQTPLYRLVLFSAVWVLFILIFFSLSGTKLLTYILPLFPGLALLSGATFLRATENPAHHKVGQWLFVSAAVLFSVALIAGVVFATAMDKLLPREAEAIVADNYNLIAVGILLLGIGLTTFLLKQRRIPQSVYALTLTLCGVVLTAMIGILPNVNAATQGDLNRFVKVAGQSPLITYEIRKPSLVFYSQRKVEHIAREERNKLAQLLAANHGKLFIITKNDMVHDLHKDVPAGASLEVVDQGARYGLHSLQASPHISSPATTGP